MKIETITRNYIDHKGEPRTYTAQRSEVEVALGGNVRSIEVERLTENHVWHATTATVVVRFPTGSKEHVVRRPSIIQRGSKWVVAVQGFRNRNTCTPVRWADDGDIGSGWNG